MKAATLARLVAARAARWPVALVTLLESGAQSLIGAAGETQGAPLPDDLATAAREALAEDSSRTVETAEGRAFIHVHAPPHRLIVVGAVHVTQPLVRIAALAGYDVSVIDPRAAFASDARFPEVSVIGEWPDEALARLAPDARTAVVTLTHDPKLDDPALIVALVSPAFYVGALGSRRTHAKRCLRLTEAGLDAASLARLHAPIGLAIGAVSPAEIAIAVMAEITAVRRLGDTRRAAA